MWRSLGKAKFDCHDCGSRYLYADGMQEQETGIKVCHDCHMVRVRAHWEAQPDGFYAVSMSNGATGEVLCTSYLYNAGGRLYPVTFDAA